MEASDDFDEEAVDVLQGFIVRFESFDELRRGVEELLRQDRSANVLKQDAPFRELRAVVRSTQEQDTIS